MTTTTDTDALLTADDVAAYREQGYWLSPVVLDERLLDAALYGQDRFYAGDHDAPFPGRTRFDHTDWEPSHGDGLRKNDYARLQVRELGALATAPIIGAVAARLAGVDEIRLWHDQLLFKPPGRGDASGNVGWHTDRQYWQTCSSEEMLTAWVPFTDVDAELGPVMFVAGSHRWPQADLDFFDRDLARGERAFAQRGEPVHRVTQVMRRGQVSFHHCRTVHGSGPNRTDRPRRSMAIHLQPAGNRYRRLDPPAYHRNDDLVRRVDGLPDYADPRICPRVWPAPV